MRKIILATTAMLVLATASVQADPHRYRRVQNHSHGNHWGTPLLGGLIVGGIVGGMMAQPYLERHDCPYGTELRRVQVYDENGRHISNRLVCVEY